MNSNEIISTLKLSKHPEGGYYKETYRSNEEMETDRGKRNVSTAIYFLLEENDRSKFHRIKSDECWFFHQGNAVEIFILSDEVLKTVVLGNMILKNEIPQTIIPANSWFAAKVRDEKGFALVSCTVAPGFDFRDFEMAERKQLLKEFPDQPEIIHAFTAEEI
jgi:predicted cupin superfamily sugar epimerase